MSAQAPSAVILVRATSFVPNPATAADNAFQADAPAGQTEASTAARVILDGVERRRARVLVGPDAYVIDALVRLFPSGYQKGTVAVSRHFGVI